MAPEQVQWKFINRICQENHGRSGGAQPGRQQGHFGIFCHIAHRIPDPLRYRFLRLSRDTHSGEEVSKMLIPKSRKEMFFKVANWETDKTPNPAYGLSIGGAFTRIYAGGVCPAVNVRWLIIRPPPKALLYPLPLILENWHGCHRSIRP